MNYKLNYINIDLTKTSKRYVKNEIAN